MALRTTGQTFLQTIFLNYCRFFIPKNKRILMFGCPGADFLEALKPSHAVGVVPEGWPGQKNTTADIRTVAAVESFITKQTFDYIIIHSVLADVSDIRNFLVGIKAMAEPGARIIINSGNPMWGFWQNAGKMRGKIGPAGENRPNRLGRKDLDNLLAVSGYELIHREHYGLFPWPVPYWSAFVNRFLAKLPLLKRCCPQFLTVIRPQRSATENRLAATSVVITCRDEEGNIEPLVERIPVMGAKTEIIFVEGHSVDNTVEKIREMTQKYPDKDIKLFHQTGIGQGDAFRLGFDRAEGEFLIWLEADLTTPPEEASHLWAAYADGHGEYINGSRFVYPMAPGAMPLINRMGNRLFSRIMSIVTRRRFTDTLCGFKGITRQGYRDITANPSRFDALDPFGDFLLILGAVKHNLKIVEVPVHYRPRRYGESKAYGPSWRGLLKHARILFKICRQSFIDFRLR